MNKNLAEQQNINRLTLIVAHLQGTQSHRTKANLAKEPQFLQMHHRNSTIKKITRNQAKLHL